MPNFGGEEIKKHQKYHHNKYKKSNYLELKQVISIWVNIVFGKSLITPFPFQWFYIYIACNSLFFKMIFRTIYLVTKLEII